MAQGRYVYTARTDNNNGYTSVSGTSFSCPLTAGVAALILEANPTWTNTDIMFAMKLAARNASRPDNRMGWGIIDAVRAAFFPLKNVYPPSHFAAKRLENNFGFFKEYIDRLTWRPNSRNQGTIRGVRIYALNLEQAGGQFILMTELGSVTFQYERRGLRAEETFLYKITAIDENGFESDPDYARQ
jgi:subtilisin family serine protease